MKRTQSVPEENGDEQQKKKAKKTQIKMPIAPITKKEGARGALSILTIKESRVRTTRTAPRRKRTQECDLSCAKITKQSSK